MKNIIRKIRFNKLTNEGKVLHTKKMVANSLSMFSKMNKELEEANNTLETVITQDTAVLSDISNNIDNANAELEANKALQGKLSQFIKGDIE